jgi:hypothetical protein
MHREDTEPCGCHVEERQRDVHTYGATPEEWCADHRTWHAAEHHPFTGGDVCTVCGNAAHWHRT